MTYNPSHIFIILHFSNKSNFPTYESRKIYLES